MTANTLDRLGSDQRERYYARLEERRALSLEHQNCQESYTRARAEQQRLRGEVGRIEQSLIGLELERRWRRPGGVSEHERERRRLPNQRDLERTRAAFERASQEERQLYEERDRLSERLRSLDQLIEAYALAGVDSGARISGGSAA